MADASEYESDEFLKLLTEALRAGPGSPQWHEAVARLRESQPGEADELKLLLKAREDLESGREYRSIRPGPGFTKKVMQRLDEAEAAGKGVSPANLIAILGGIGILAVLGVVVFLLVRGAGQNSTVADLAATEFSKPAAADFSAAIGADWKKFGLEPVVVVREKSLRGGFHPDEKEYKGGGIYLAKAIEAEQGFAIDATILMKKPTGQVDLQVFVSEDPSFSGSQATSKRELIVDLRDGQVSVYKPDTSAAGEPVRLSEGKEGVALSLKMDRQFVIVVCNGKELYAGPHGLTPGKARWPGVRFLTKGPERSLDDVTVQVLRVLKPS